MSRRRFFSSAAASSSQPSSRLRSWAECYAASCSSESDGSGRESPDQSHTVDPPPSSSSSLAQSSSSHHSRCSSSSPGASPLHRGGRSRSCSPAVSLASERTVLLLSRAPSASWSRPSTSRNRPARRAADQDRNGSPSSPDLLSSRGGLSRRRRLQVLFRRTHHGRRLWGHLPVAIPPDRWYTGVGSLVCAQCRSQRSFQRTSWMCLECQVPLCLMTWRNCYSQWHSGE